MSLLRTKPTRRFVVLAPLALAACGFEPVYGPGGNGASLQNRVLVDPPSTQDGYLLVRELEEKLGRAAQPAFALSLTINTAETPRAIPGGSTGSGLSITACAMWPRGRL
jgi:LPS-assembly lipoprotein